MKEKKTGLYRAYDEEGLLLYIGISLAAFNRLSQHNINSIWADDAMRIEVEYFDNRGLALAAEKKAIKVEYPKFNNRHNCGVRPSSLHNTYVCSFKYYNEQGKVVTGLRIDRFPGSDGLKKPDLVMGKMDERIYDIAGNAIRLYKIVGFECWAGQYLEIEIHTLLDILGFEYGFKYFVDFKKIVIDPAFKMIEKYSTKSLSYTTKAVDNCVTHVVFLNNNEPITSPTYLEVRASNLRRRNLFFDL